MKKVWSFIIVLLCMGLTAHAELFQLDGTPFQPPTNAVIAWTATVTNLPENLWVYKVIPENFSMAVFSNLLTLGHVESKNLAKPTEMQVPDPNYVRFEILNPKGRHLHILDIAPNLGWVKYQSNSGDDNDKVEPAPSLSKVTDLAFDILFQCGIDRSQVLPTPKNYSTSTTQIADGPEIISARRVFLVRSIDGINESGFCLAANFGTHNAEPKLLSFDLNWRGLLPYEARRVATTNEIMDLIKNGKATIPPQDIDFEQLQHAKKLTVTTFFPLYYSKMGFNKLDFEYPYVVMDIVADIGDGKTISFTMNCPILTAN